MDRQRMLIDGELVAAEGGREYENVNPADEQVIGTAPDATAGDVERAVAAARRAFDDGRWAEDVEFRRHCLLQLQERLRKNVEEIRGAHTAESGMPVSLAHSLGVDVPIDGLGYWPGLLGTYQWEYELPPVEFMGARSKRVVRREADGVVGAITPWNYPFQLNLTKLGAPLAAGCTVVLKGAPDTPYSATLLAEAVAATDIPPGVVNIITTQDNAVAEILTKHAAIDHVTFTGSTQTGRLVMRNAAETIKKVSLELGGKSATIVLDDADLAQILPFAAGIVCMHAGQGCALMTRVLVPDALMGAAAEIVKAVFAQFPYGDPRDPGTMMGPLVNARQRDRVLGYIETGKAEAELIVGGGRPEGFDKGFWVEPTAFANVPNDARIAREEIFGPVLCLIGYEDEEDAIRIANDSPYGLSGSVFSADLDRALAVAKRIRTGSIGVNGGGFTAPDTPYGGYKQSGVGREFGVEGLEGFLETKALGIPVL
ncbi:aldehyde dehydrogenase (NAD+) [Actinocorallia herbida]|uniref:Aldehyde dehydrogenase (NAD+) n=1 Tax=Actinocorallia herbida TaxID=58109 RepID=A0A3N1D3B2_9ACTN|nr:aldehyde dehydrogenase family protein [Actinocorallia herbida]ROO87999.1 aldehyde dehydrogenase (NAD+) [Actinocorallia herbida]